MKRFSKALLSLTLLSAVSGFAQAAQAEETEQAQQSVYHPSGWSVRGGLGYLKGTSVPVLDLELELAYRFAVWQHRFEIGLLYGAYAPFSLPELREVGGPFGLSTLHGLQLRGRFYLFDPAVSSQSVWGKGLDPYVTIQAGATNWPERSNWILPSFGIGLDWWMTPQLALSPAVYVPFWTNSTLGVQMQPELALKWRF